MAKNETSMNVLPSEVHHFPSLNPGRQDSASWGDPAKELRADLAIPAGWTTAVGSAVVAYPIETVAMDGVSIEVACQQRQATYEALLKEDDKVAKVYKALYFENGKPIAPKYMGGCGFRRSTALPYAVTDWIADDPSRSIRDYTMPIVVTTWRDSTAFVLNALAENNQFGRRKYSFAGLLAIFAILVEKGYGAKPCGTLAGLKWGTLPQKLWYAARLANTYPAINLIGRIGMSESWVDDKDHSKGYRYEPDGFVPFGPLNYKAMATLLGVRSTAKGSEGQPLDKPVLDSMAGDIATLDEVEAYLERCVGGRSKESNSMSKAKILHLCDNWKPRTHMANVFDVLDAIYTDNGDFFDALAKTWKESETANSPEPATPAPAPTKKLKGGKSGK